MKNQSLTPKETNNLRDRNLIYENEFAYKAGDLIVAENPVTGEKRVIGKIALITETNKRVLRG